MAPERPNDAFNWQQVAEELAGIGYWRMDPATGAVEWSPNMFKLFEFPAGIAPRAEETMSRIHPDDRAAAYVDLSSNLHEGGHVSISRLMLPSGGVRIVESRTTTVRNEIGEIATIVGSVLDVTQRTAREHDLSVARDLAESDATREITFAADLGHEIRTPLMAIVGYAHLLATREDLSPAALRDVDLIARSSETLLAIANSVLGRSRANQMLSKVNLVPISTARVIKSVLDLFADQANTKGLELHHAQARSVPEFLLAHADALTQILVNLVGNAVKFTDTGSITVSTAYDQFEQVLSMTVQDTGRGFDEATRETLFDRFARGDHAGYNSSGAGLGLSICKVLVNAMGGTIEADSSLGAGTCVTFCLPAHPSPPPASVLVGGSPSRNVLVVDDHPAVLEVSTRILEAAGVLVDSARDARTALLLAKAKRYDLILLDLNLPDGSGFDVAKAIRNVGEPNASTRLFAFTAKDIDAGGLPQIFDGYVGKPIDPRKLAALALDESAKQAGQGR